MDKKDMNSNTHPMRVARTGAPEPASTCQREIVLELLRAAGRVGINRDHFLMGTGPCSGHRMTQVGARLDELEEEGFTFESFKANETDRFVTYRLISEPVTRVERPKFRVKKRKKDQPGPIAQAVAMLPVAFAAERIAETLAASITVETDEGPVTTAGLKHDTTYHLDIAGASVRVRESCPPADAKVAVRIADVTPGQSLSGQENALQTLKDLQQPTLFSDTPPAIWRDPESQT